MNAIYYLYYPAWPDKKEQAFDIAFPELNEDDAGTLGAFLFTEVDGMIYKDIKTCIENVLNHVTENESYTGNVYHLQIDADVTTIFDLYSNEGDDYSDEDEFDEEEFDEDEDLREIEPTLEISTSDLLAIMKDYRAKKDAFASGWRPSIVIEEAPDKITQALVVSKNSK